MELYSKALQDALSRPMILLALLPLFTGAVIAYFSFYFLIEPLHALILDWLQGGVLPYWIDSILKALWGILLGVGAILWFVMAVMIVQLFLGIFYAPWIVAYVQKRHYPSLRLLEGESLLGGICDFTSLLFRFLGILLLSLPLSFIPFVGPLIWLWPFFYLFYQSLMLDVSGVIFSKEERIALEIRLGWRVKRFLLGLYLLEVIPLLNLFVPIFQILSLAHFLLSEKERSLS